MYSKQDCIDALQEAAEKLGHSPTAPEYRELDIYPTYSTFYEKFDGWNKAKEEAGLKTYTTTTKTIPEEVDIGEEKWENMSKSERHRIRRNVKAARIKINTGCEICGYDEHPKSLDFHHTNPEEKEGEVSKLIANSSWERAKEEMEKCDIVCANCHRKFDANIPYNEGFVETPREHEEL